MTFSVIETKVGGIIGSLQVTFGSVEK